MKSILHFIKTRANLFFKIKHFEGTTSAVRELKMTDRLSDADTETPPEKKICLENIQNQSKIETKVKQKKVVVLLTYLGDNYFGMQRNYAIKTVEGELISALCKANAIPSIAVTEPYKINFQRTARTDKGVSAVKQVVCLKLAEHSNVETINEHLPDDIRVLSIKRVTRGFQCQGECTARIYSYTLPTFALAPEFHKEYPKNYRISEELKQKVNDILNLYVGTHNFHNFTSRKLFQDPSSKRYIMSFAAGEPFLGEGEEFITLKVKGQSFMLHQIRKMVGHMIAILKGVTPPNIECDVWTEQRYAVPMVPGLGLILEDVLFDRYNRKYKDDGIHEALTFDELADEIKKHREKILSNIIKKEIEEKVMFTWLGKLEGHSYLRDETTCKEDEEPIIEENAGVTTAN